MDGFFERHDALVLPTTATTAPENVMRVPQGEGGAVNPWLISTLHVPLANLIHAPGTRHMPQTRMVLPPAVSSRWNTLSSQDLSAARSNTTRWPSRAPQRSM